ncbi:MAG: ketopantoate reductase family protein [Ktedonobacterales bacterium]
MRIAVVGAGGTGGFFGGLLARAGEDTTLIARGVQLAAILSGGLTVHSRHAGDFTLPIPVSGDAGAVGPVDLVLFCVKAYDATEAAEQIRPLIGERTAVLPLLNGIDHIDLLARTVGREHVLGGVAMVTAAITAPGVVTQSGGSGSILLGELDDQQSPRVERIAAALTHAGIAATITADIQAAMWDKLVFICGVSGMTALARLPIGTVLATPATREMLAGVFDEVEAVTRARGVALAPDAAGRAMRMAARLEPWARGSMAHDLATGHRMELDALNGAVVRLGRELGVPTPLNFAIAAALAPYIDGTPATIEPVPRG